MVPVQPSQEPTPRAVPITAAQFKDAKKANLGSFDEVFARTVTVELSESDSDDEGRYMYAKYKRRCVMKRQQAMSFEEYMANNVRSMEGQRRLVK